MKYKPTKKKEFKIIVWHLIGLLNLEMMKGCGF